MSKRVVITGCGVVTAAGTTLDGFWSGLMSGTCFIRPLQHFKAPGMEGIVGGEVELPADESFPPELGIDGPRSRCAELALAASRRALDDAALPGETADRDRIGVVLGTTLGEERQVGDLNERWVAQGPDAVDAGFIGRCDNHRLAAVIASRHELGGPVLLSATACSSGNAATAWAYDMVASGAADAMVAGGADTFTRLIYCGFSRMGALSKGIGRPFDRHRDGVSFGEGSGMVVLEELEHARRRGARIYAELCGYGISNDAFHITGPEPHGDGVVRAVRQALATTRIEADAIDYVSAHGTGTQQNDLGEMRAMRTLFGDRAGSVPLSSIKSMLGHTNGAASAIETVACALALEHQAVPPTINLVEPEPGFDLDHVPGTGRAMRVETCLNLAAGFGGFNVCVVLRRAP